MFGILNLLVLLIFVVVVLLGNTWHRSRSRRIIERWAQSNGYEILSSEHWEILTGQEVYLVTIRTSEGEIRRGRVWCGIWLLGTFVNATKVRWEASAMNDLHQDIEVVMTFLRTEEGGRKSPVFSGYRPQFHYEGNLGDAQHTYLDVDQVNPGDTVTAQLMFYCPENHAGKIAVGMEFQIGEGNRTVAVGHVTKILHLEERAAKKDGSPP